MSVIWGLALCIFCHIYLYLISYELSYRVINKWHMNKHEPLTDQYVNRNRGRDKGGVWNQWERTDRVPFTDPGPGF